MREYQIDPDGQLRNVDDLRDLVHNLACMLHDLLQRPMVRMSMNPMEFMISMAAAEAAHNATCPHVEAAAHLEEGHTVEGSLGHAPEIKGLEDLRDLFKDL